MKITDGVYAYEKPGMGQNGSHTYVLKGAARMLLIDPGFTHNLEELVIKPMVKDGLNPRNVDWVTNTHLHADHSQADDRFAERFDAEVVLHESQKELIEGSLNHSIFSVPRIVNDGYGDEINLGGRKLRVFETPGHAQGHVCFYLPSDGVLVGGDLIFDRNVGRVDLPGSDENEAKESVRRMTELDVDILLPGHGTLFTEKESVKENMDFILENWARLP